MKRRYLGLQSQAVRLPEYVRANPDRMEVLRIGDEFVMRETPINASAIFDALSILPDDFMAEGREDSLPQQHEAFGL
ncbi:antitoxin [Methylomonas sp. DH-1]|uniref:antitoxin n=1 Tax=Methylomonas sp. (strain DH-1) TaxID=1727196 RepID=UPI0007C9B142|nr:hypothetical protein [Methylomonas sp. DH-1]ANE55001.1 hypothetical protein AYM39_07295 [Methylomonas sp. DH-1]